MNIKKSIASLFGAATCLGMTACETIPVEVHTYRHTGPVYPVHVAPAYYAPPIRYYHPAPVPIYGTVPTYTPYRHVAPPYGRHLR